MAEKNSGTTPSLFARLKRTPKLSALGFFLVLGAFPLLYGNEQRAVAVHRAFDEGAASVVHVMSDKVDAANEGKVVHLTGTVTTDETLRDELFGVSAKALRLERHVEMYQWDEANRVVDGKTEFTYTKRWSPTVIDAGKFHEPADHKNPSLFPYEERFVTAQAARVGAFSLPKEGLEKLNAFEPLVPTAEMLAGAPADARAKLKIAPGALFMGASPDAPQVGDLRITFQIVKPAQASVVGMQAAQAVTPAVLSTDRTLLLVAPGEVDEKTMFGKAPAEPSPLFLYFRIGGAVAMAIGLFILFGVFALERERSRMGTVKLLGQRGIASVFFAVALGGAVVSAPWFEYRTWAGVGVVAAAIVAWALGMLVLRKKPAAV